MDTELILAIVGVGFAVIALGLLSVYQQGRSRREKQQKAEAVRRPAAATGAAAAGPTRFFVCQYRGRNARFFRVYSDDDALLFLDAGPYIIMVDAETPRGTDHRHWAVRSARALAVAAAGAAAVVAALAWDLVAIADHYPEAAGSSVPLVLGLLGMVAFALGVAVPVVAVRIRRRAAELDALTVDGLRERAETDDGSFRAAPGSVSGVRFASLGSGPSLAGGGAIGATLTFRHEPTGRWTIETTTTEDTRDVIAAFRTTLGPKAVAVEGVLKDGLSGRVPESKAATPAGRGWDDAKAPAARRFGFPLWMLAGFGIGAAVATAAAFVLAGDPGGRFSYVGLVKLLFSLGGLGAYAGHVAGAAVNRSARIRPFGPLPLGAMALGGGIVLLGSAAILQVVWWVVGPPQ